MQFKNTNGGEAMPKMMILDKNDPWPTHGAKLIEEAEELAEGIENGDKANIAEEAFDTIQVCIGILDKLRIEGIDIRTECLRHEKKLINRGWKHKGILEIEVRNSGRV